MSHYPHESIFHCGWGPCCGQESQALLNDRFCCPLNLALPYATGRLVAFHLLLAPPGPAPRSSKQQPATPSALAPISVATLTKLNALAAGAKCRRQLRERDIPGRRRSAIRPLCVHGTNLSCGVSFADRSV